MPWLLLLHMSALLCWCGALLYLPALISGSTRSDLLATDTLVKRSAVPRFVFTLVATPAALIAIGSGTAVFVAHGIVTFWLIAKLTLVSLLVLGHAAMGFLVARADRLEQPRLTRYCVLLAGFLACLMLTIIWLVLAKPLQEG